MPEKAGDGWDAAEALRRYRADRDVAPGETLEVVLEAEDDGRAATYKAVADELAALCRTRLVFDETAPDGATHILLTHAHFDHIVDALPLALAQPYVEPLARVAIEGGALGAELLTAIKDNLENTVAMLA